MTRGRREAPCFKGAGKTTDEGRADQAWREAVEAGRVERCDKAPFVSSATFALVDFLGRDAADTFEPAFPLLLLAA